MAPLRPSKHTLLCGVSILLGILPFLTHANTPENFVNEEAAAAKIDRLILAKIEASGKQPAPAIDEHTFTRRVYLDTIGRIPTVSELETYINYEHPDRRNRLINFLSAHPGRTSHQFNIWADLLRIKTRTQQEGVGAAYANWVKEAIAQNMPYDQFVRSLVTAEGYPWENGAVGYSMRDAGMPLDNLSNTVQVFLGTQIVCAQCHDHPFDDWTQHQYYEIAAMTYGLHNRKNMYDLEGFRGFRDLLKESSLKKGERERVRRAAGLLMRPLRDGNTNSGRQLKLPHDYQYDDADPKQIVEPYPLYGEIEEEITIDNRLEMFATWLTEPGNDRFAKTIANRTWKRLMGVGLFEPVDDYRPTTKISNPELLAFLEELMIRSGYDLRLFERIILKTEAYLRAALPYKPDNYKDYAFEGQQLKRLSAEQLWDSLIAMVAEDPETIQRPYDADILFNRQKALLDLTPYQLAHMSLQYADENEAIGDLIREKNQKLNQYRQAGNSKQVRVLQQEVGKLYRERRQLESNLVFKYLEMPADAQSNAMAGDSMMSMMDSAMMMEQQAATEDRQKLLRNMRGMRKARASELESPTNAGHLLRELGQSDREVIDNAAREATVPQVLAMMNGTWQHQLWSKESTLNARVKELYDNEDILDTLFKAALSRPARREETVLLAEKMDSFTYNEKDVLWALLNTRQFMFVQ